MPRNRHFFIDLFVTICYFIKRKKEKGGFYMLNDEICMLREKLNQSIITGQDYAITYKLSVELDELIAEYYRKSIEA